MCLHLTSFSINIVLFSKNITCVCVRVVVQKNKWFDVKEQKPSQVNQAKWQAAKSIKLKNNGMSNIKKQG
jgi:hypothetical protein